MSQSRLAQLEQFYLEDPADPFNAYALAIEYLNFNHSKSRALFDKLLNEHPDYVPTYYHAGKLAETVEDFAKAEEIYLKGIDVARRNGDTKAMRELRSALDLLQS
jgi:tetratricopeptide (TPR) repeat protein